MNLYLSIGLCFTPLIIIIIITNLLVPDLKNKTILVAIIAGIGAIIPVALAQFFLFSFQPSTNKTLLTVLISALLFNGLIEETIKMLFISFIPSKTKSFSSFFVAALIAGCSFGCFEAIVYLIAEPKSINIRLFTAVILHIFCAGLSGIFVWSAKNHNGLLRSFLTAILLHGIYNFFAGFSTNFWWFSIVAILLSGFQCRVYYVQVAENLPHATTGQLDLFE